ncbi:MAG: DUF2079 domain-containing protein [Chthoniobacteraceae bacterium]
MSTTPRAIRLSAVFFALAVFLVSWWHWWTFQYGTFDLAFYVQALWLALRGKWWVSLLNVPLMGNHAEPIVFLLTPLFALWPHPMLFVVVQTVALASMAFTGFRIASRLGVGQPAATALGLALLVLPATGSVGIYEFHPEALVAPLLLLLIEAKLAERYGAFWLWFLAVLACKENMALLLVAFCGVFAVLERRRGGAWLVRWNLAPLLLATAWLAICGAVIGPRLNAGNVDYGQLYAHLGRNAGEIVRNFFLEPHRAGTALWRALTEGNMVWAFLLPLLFLPLLRLRWLLVAAPLLLQHLLSWRFTEWSLGAHYPAPFIPLFWIAAVEGLGRLRAPRGMAFGVLAACVLAHLRFGPARDLIAQVPGLRAKLEEREWKAQMLANIPPGASVTAVQSFLSHLAKREHLYSLHHVLKGLKTLSKEPYVPPLTDVVVIDYSDLNTFSTVAGFYHPRSRVDAEREVASSDRLLHEYLRQRNWHVQARNELAVLSPGESAPAFAPNTPPVPFDAQTTLLNLQIPATRPGAMRLRFAWEFGAERERFPWLMLVLSDGRQLFPFLKGACAPEAGPGRYYEDWLIAFPSDLPAGYYEMFALFFDANEAAWTKKTPPGDMTYVLRKIELGQQHIIPGEMEPANTDRPEH